MDDDSYYCNKELVQLLVFDAKVTNESYRLWEFDDEREVIEKYNATVRFVGTMSGLTRWQFIYGEVEVENDTEFGDYDRKAIDETWYKTAILQHHIDQHRYLNKSNSSQKILKPLFISALLTRCRWKRMSEKKVN